MKKELLFKLSRILLKFKEITIEDKTYVVDKLEIGGVIMDENDTPIADGEYIIENQKVKVENGLISEIEEVKEEEEENNTENLEEIPEEETVERDKEIEDLKNEIENLKNEIISKDKEIEDLKAKLEEPVETPVEMNRTEKVMGEKKGALKYFG